MPFHVLSISLDTFQWGAGSCSNMDRSIRGRVLVFTQFFNVNLDINGEELNDMVKNTVSFPFKRLEGKIKVNLILLHAPTHLIVLMMSKHKPYQTPKLK